MPGFPPTPLSDILPVPPPVPARISVGGHKPPAKRLEAAAKPSAPVRVVRLVLTQLGVKYAYGGANTNGFDCSGLIYWAYRKAAGLTLPRTTYGQIGKGLHVTLKGVRVGDVVFVNDAHHEGIYIGNGVVVHAPHTGDVVRKLSLTYLLRERLTGIRRYFKLDGKPVL